LQFGLGAVASAEPLAGDHRIDASEASIPLSRRVRPRLPQRRIESALRPGEPGALGEPLTPALRATPPVTDPLALRPFTRLKGRGESEIVNSSFVSNLIKAAIPS